MKMAWKHLRLDESNCKWLTLWIDVADRKLNVLSSQVFHELQQVTQWLQEHERSRPIILRSAKDRGFIVGADLREILQVQCDAEIQQFLRLGQVALDAWEQLPNPTVAWIRGACLGGGLELAMACRFRMVCDSEDTQLGMPESKLGLTPGWGGTQRLPTLVGIPDAMQMLLYGDSIGCNAAAAMGLADGTWSLDSIEDEIASWVARCVDEGACTTRPRLSTVELRHQWDQWALQNLATLEQTGTELDVARAARQAILRAVEKGLQDSTAAGMQMERENFFALLNRPEVQTLLQRFSPRKSPETP